MLLGAGTSQGMTGSVSDRLVRFWRAREDLSNQKGRIDRNLQVQQRAAVVQGPAEMLRGSAEPGERNGSSGRCGEAGGSNACQARTGRGDCGCLAWRRGG